MPMPRRLKAAVFVRDPATREELVLRPGDAPEPEIAALVTHPDAWDGPAEDPEEDVASSSPGSTPAGKPAGDEAGTGRKTASRRPRSASSD
ncbi:hypothetical protein [Streptomyces jumonjinensis]|uniref:Uncharacterized protein n=1 Tax=Streptomyces jumonjinensis TaxID=1945 RepID=A0A646KT42_STRJU|nr:hypothetical protein [Streptomyces jumonjinensis]MQT05405.1 hypothetical protein [Streptomyces jumonjinensis]